MAIMIESGMSTNMLNFQFGRHGIPQAGLHYDEHERIGNTAWHDDPAMIILMEALVATQGIGYEKIQEVQMEEEHRSKFLAKKIRRSLRAFDVEKMECLGGQGQGFIFCAAGKRKITVLNLTDLSVTVISNKELFYYLKRMRKGEL